VVGSRPGVRVTHTPGEKLDRPDQTSRGDAAEEPRARLSADVWRAVEERWGPFDHFLGAERDLGSAVRAQEASATERIWTHPTMSTVGTALRRVGERMARSGGHGAVALALVTSDGRAAWAGLLRHGLVAGRVEVGDAVLDMNVLGQWQRCRARRASQLVLFPRVAGASVRQLEITVEEGMEERIVAPGSAHERRALRGEGYVGAERDEALRLPVMPGSFMYSLPAGGAADGRGCLYRAVLPTEEEGGVGAVVGQECLLDASRAARRLTALPVFEVSSGGGRWRPDPRQVWAVDHLVEVLSSKGRATKVAFDFVRANREVERQGGAGEGDAGWESRSPAAGPELKAAQEGSGDYAEGYTPFFEEEEMRWSEEADELVQVTTQLDQLRLAQSAAKTGTEGRVLGRGAVARGGELEGLTGGVCQPCQYASIECAGCHVFFAVGEMMLSHGTALVHRSQVCRVAYDAGAALMVQQELAAAGSATRYYGVYSDEVGASGVHLDWADVARLVEGAEGRAAHAAWAAFDTLAEAVEFVRERTAARAGEPGGGGAGVVGIEGATELQPGGARRGSATRVALLGEKLSVSRVERIVTCIEGACGLPRGDGSETGCLGGCGRMLHVESCAQLGPGYAALGNFTCPECRLEAAGLDPAREEAGFPLRPTATRTMVLELGQGRETTAAGYAEYVRLEELYVRDVGQLVDGHGLRMPRHSASSFKQFVTWLVGDADRAGSLESMVRSAGGFLTKVPGLTDWTQESSVKAHMAAARRGEARRGRGRGHEGEVR
jgi:hypothetical protein